MPQIPIDPAVMIPLFENAKKCFVTINKVVKHEKIKEVRAGNGFVVHCDNQFTVVVANHSATFQGPHNIRIRMRSGSKVTMKFFDGTRATDTAFIRLDRSVSLIVARIPLGGWQSAEFGELSEERHEKVLSVATLGSVIAPFVGQVISRRAVAVDKEKNVIPSSRDTFTFSLPMAGRMCAKEGHKYEERFENLKTQVLGSPVFNFYGRLVGFLDRCGHSFDFKFGIRSEELQAAIHRWLAGRTWKDAVGPHINRGQHEGGSKRIKRT